MKEVLKWMASPRMQECLGVRFAMSVRFGTGRDLSFICSAFNIVAIYVCDVDLLSCDELLQGPAHYERLNSLW